MGALRPPGLFHLIIHGMHLLAKPYHQLALPFRVLGDVEVDLFGDQHGVLFMGCEYAAYRLPPSLSSITTGKVRSFRKSGAPDMP